MQEARWPRLGGLNQLLSSTHIVLDVKQRGLRELVRALSKRVRRASRRGYAPEDWDAVDSPEATDAELAQAKPFAEVFPDIADAVKRPSALTAASPDASSDAPPAA